MIVHRISAHLHPTPDGGGYVKSHMNTICAAAGHRTGAPAYALITTGTPIASATTAIRRSYVASDTTCRCVRK